VNSEQSRIDLITRLVDSVVEESRSHVDLAYNLECLFETIRAFAGIRWQESFFSTVENADTGSVMVVLAPEEGEG
jgi:hypothetical protein